MTKHCRANRHVFDTGGHCIQCDYTHGAMPDPRCTCICGDRWENNLPGCPIHGQGSEEGMKRPCPQCGAMVSGISATGEHREDCVFRTHRAVTGVGPFRWQEGEKPPAYDSPDGWWLRLSGEDRQRVMERAQGTEPAPELEEGLLTTTARAIRHANQANGWRVPTTDDWTDPNRIPTFLCLIHSEVSEALEGFRAGDRENVAEELADVLIRVLDLAIGLGIDMDNEVWNKIEANKKRGYKHGGKAI